MTQMVEALRYKPEGRGFDPRWCHWNFSFDIMALGSTQPLTEMSTRNISLGDEPYHLHVSLNLGASTSWNSQGLSRPVMGLLNSLRQADHSLRGVLPSVVCDREALEGGSVTRNWVEAPQEKKKCLHK